MGVGRMAEAAIQSCVGLKINALSSGSPTVPHEAPLFADGSRSAGPLSVRGRHGASGRSKRASRTRKSTDEQVRTHIEGSNQRPSAGIREVRRDVQHTLERRGSPRRHVRTPTSVPRQSHRRVRSGDRRRRGRRRFPWHARRSTRRWLEWGGLCRVGKPRSGSSGRP